MATFDGAPRNRRLDVYEVGRTVRRGTDPSQDPLPVLSPDRKLFPVLDPVLNDGQNYFYLVR